MDTAAEALLKNNCARQSAFGGELRLTTCWALIQCLPLASAASRGVKPANQALLPWQPTGATYCPVLNKLNTNSQKKQTAKWYDGQPASQASHIDGLAQN
eukprot:3669706-Amphidinium_carterae.1